MDYSYTPGYTLAMGILNKNCIGHLLRTSREYFRPPPPKVLLEKMNNIYVHFRRIFVEFVVVLTKIWHTKRYSIY